MRQGRDAAPSDGLVVGAARAGLPERRRHRDPLVRLRAVLDGLALGATRGLEDHDRRLTARKALLRRIAPPCRSNSHLPKLVELVIAAPLVATEIAAGALRVTPLAALGLVAELRLRKITERGRFRAWTVG